MSHNSHVEVPGAFHLVERRIRRGRPVLQEFHDRHLSLATIHGSMYEHGIQICGYNILPDRVLLVLIPKEPDAIGLALMHADRSPVREHTEIHHFAAPCWERDYSVCPFADEASWRVLRYVDMASVRVSGGDPLDRHALNSAVEHAGLARHGLLTAPPERMPNQAAWPIFVGTPEDEKFMQVLELSLRTGRPFGPMSFAHKVEEACGRHVRSACLEWSASFADASCQSHVELRQVPAGPVAVYANPAAARSATLHYAGRGGA
jgi:hypothetical protein